MHIPPAWAKASSTVFAPDGREVPVSVWGWGEDEIVAKKGAADRLQRLSGRIRRGEPLPDKYEYGSRPVREEILQTVESATPGEPLGVVTRNVYGAQILNTPRLLFLDIDVRPASFVQRVLRMFGRGAKEEAVVDTLRSALQKYGGATFRLYRTAAGLRAIAIDRDFDPTGDEAQQLMRTTKADPRYARLCLARRSFRARLTPKPWRCNSAPPPGLHPRAEGECQIRFESWLRQYEELSAGYATCRYLETVGKGMPKGDASKLLEVHDRATRSNEPLPLA